MKNKIVPILLVGLVSITNSLIAQNKIMCLTKNFVAPTSFDTTFKNCMADNFYLWDNGKKLIVKFLNGNTSLQEKTKIIAKQWEHNTNIRFEFVTEGLSHIRIEFTNKGYLQSAIGTQALMYSQDEASAQIDTTEFTNHQLMQGMILHLFGHVLGLQDEVSVHQNGINWNEERLSSYSLKIKSLNGIAKEIVKGKYFINQLNWLKYDTQSVMVAPLLKPLSSNVPSSYWNSYLSNNDKALISSIYPKKEIKDNNLAKPTINFSGLKIIRSNIKNGISFYPIFDFINRANGGIRFLLVLVDKNNNPISTSNRDYNVLKQVGTSLQPNIVGYNIKNINKTKLTDVEFFIPTFIIQNIKKEDGIFAVFKVFYQNPETDISEWLYVSKPYAIK